MNMVFFSSDILSTDKFDEKFLSFLQNFFHSYILYITCFRNQELLFVFVY